MPKITVQARRCPFTSKIFVDDKKYFTHLKKIRMKNKLKQLDNSLCVIKEKLLTIQSFPALIKLIETHHNEVAIANAFPDSSKIKLLSDKEKCDIKIKKLSLRYSNLVSNTHYAPIGKPKNWHRSYDLPRGYPGWQGYIMFETTKQTECFSSHIFKTFRVNLGTGGGSTTSSRYEVKIFLEDFPNLEKYLMINMIKNQNFNYDYECI